ncbi:MAG: efflux RND transporter permease subunit [Planctomycetota bacterium]
MDPIRFAIDNPVKVFVGVILLLLFGALAVVSIPIQLTPNTDPTIITVSTNWTGKSPEEVEKEIIEQQEDVLKNLSGLVKMTATATQGSSEIELEFGVGVDLQLARALVSDALREVPSFEDDVDEPVISTGEAGPGSPIAWLLMTSEDKGFDVQSLGDLAIDDIKPYLERTPGVSEVRVYGGREREVHIAFDPERVAQRKLTIADLGGALRGENVNVSAGNVDEGRYDVRVRTVGQYDTLDAIRDTVVAYDPDGGPIRVRDIAEVRLTYAKRRSFVRSRGELALAMPVYRESGSNVIEVMNGLNERIDKVNRDVLPGVAVQIQQEQGLASAPKLSVRKVYDETGYIYDALDLVKNNLIIGGVLAVLALLLFLELGRRPLLVVVATPLLVLVMLGVLLFPEGAIRWWVSVGALAGIALVVLYFARPTAVVAAAIPISIVGTFVVMFVSGRNLNVISLAGLAFAVGMVVDNAIVVLENTDRHLAMGKKRMRAAYDAGKEVWGAILASTLTTLAVFLPILFIEEEAGQLFRDIALALCAAVTLSLIVSITVIPTLSARMLRERKTQRTPGVLERYSPAHLFAWVARGYGQLIYMLTSSHPSGVVGRVSIVAVLTMASALGAWMLMPPTDYLPRGNQNLVFGIMINPPGYNITTDEEIAKIVESQIAPYWEADDMADLADLPKPVLPFGGGEVDNVPPIDNYFIVSFGGTMFNGATSQDKENVKPLEGLLGSATSSVPGSIGFAAQSSLFGRGAGGSRSIDVEVRGDNLDEVRDAATAMLGALRGAYGFGGVQPSPLTFDKPRREVIFRIDRVKAADLGIDVESLGRSVSAMVDGLIIGDYRYRGDSIDIVAKNASGDGYPPEQLARLPVAYRTATGEQGTVPLSQIATIERSDAPQQISRIEESRAVTLSVTPPDDVPLEQAEQDIRAIEALLRSEQGGSQIPLAVEIAYAGSASKLEQVRTAMIGEWTGLNAESLRSLGVSRLFIALLVTFLLMAALFESFLYPLVIMFSVPLAAVGGFIGLGLVRNGLGVEEWWPWLYGVLGPSGLGMISPTQQLDTLTMLGFIILIGVVVNNAILIVHQALNYMRGLGEGEGDNTDAMGPREAIRASVQSRIRPIFMTTATSVAGMLPLVLMPGSGSELYRGLGSVVVGGLVVSTLFTLVVVPLLFSLAIDLKLGLYRLLYPGESDTTIA